MYRTFMRLCEQVWCILYLLNLCFAMSINIPNYANLKAQLNSLYPYSHFPHLSCNTPISHLIFYTVFFLWSYCMNFQLHVLCLCFSHLYFWKCNTHVLSIYHVPSIWQVASHANTVLIEPHLSPRGRDKHEKRWL